ncbi:MAG: metal ABC transporter permease [Corynebacterium sp.]|uniref:metal ABC transporter permease n=1 Tax=Corynebacterium sp. TaxID=1720 RepID=UPI0026DF4879|nr:metal ABC transporter permease [Corynebacterium sp.]MDO5669884.1 metal ABC transporter permease [Corynebacterium sp.]
MTFIFGTFLLALVTAVACALPGVFVVLRKSSMLVDGISHAVFPGIVIGYLLTHDLRSPWLLLGAALAGLLVVAGAEWLTTTGLFSGDAPQGLVFPALFALGIILVSSHLSNIHLDTHTVLVGDLNLASFDRLIVGGTDIGPSYLYIMLGVAALNTLFLTAVFPQLSAATFDPEHARVSGVPVRALGLAFMFLVSVTITAAFHAAGALLVIALVVAPAATAHLFANRLSALIAWTIIIALLGAGAGFWVAFATDTATSAAMAVFYGLLFTMTALVVNRYKPSSSRCTS